MGQVSSKVGLLNSTEISINPATEDGNLATLARAISGSEMQVDIVSGGAGNGSILDGVDTAIKASVLDYTNSNPLAVRLTDVNGDYVGAGTQYSDGDANADPTGTVAMGTDGSNIYALLTDVSGHLQVDVLSGGGGGEQYADGTIVNAAYKGTLALGTDGSNYQVLATDASGNLQVDILNGSIAVTGTFWQATQPVSGTFWQATQPVSGTFWQATQPVSIAATVTVDTELPAAAALSDTIANPTTPIIGAALMGYDVVGTVWERIITDAAGKLAIADGGGSITVDGTFWQATQPVSATDLDIRNLAQTQDNVRVWVNTVIDGTGTNVIPLADAAGHLQVDILNASIAVTGTFWQATQPISNAGITSIDGKITACNTGAVVVSSGTITAVTSITNAVAITDAITGGWDNAASDGASVSGDTAHDAADAGEPVKIGFKAVLFDGSAPPNAAVAEGDRTNAISDEYGRQFVETTHPNYWRVSADYAAAQTNVSVKAAPGVGLSIYITDVCISNGATAGNITLLDGSGGTVIYEIYPAINGGSVHALRTPIKLTANTAVCCTSTTVTTHSLNLSGFIAP